MGISEQFTFYYLHCSVFCATIGRIIRNRSVFTMEKYKRNERLTVISQMLTLSPNQIVPFSTFCDMFAAAKSTISEDIAILAESFRTFHLGTIDTVTGASGGVRYRPIPREGMGRRFLEQICARLQSP